MIYNNSLSSDMKTKCNYYYNSIPPFYSFSLIYLNIINNFIINLIFLAAAYFKDLIILILLYIFLGSITIILDYY